MASLTGWLEGAADFIEKAGKAQAKASRPTRRTPAPAPPRGSSRRSTPAEALGLTGESPFAPALRQSRDDVRRAASKLPNPPTLRQVRQGYDRAVTSVFDGQSKAVQQRVLKRAIVAPSPEGDTILAHVWGVRGDQLVQRRDFLAGWMKKAEKPSPIESAAGWLGHAASDTFDAVKTGLTPRNPDEIGMALGDPSGYLKTTDAFNHPDVANMARLQGALSTVSGKLTGLIEGAQDRGLLASGDVQTAGVPDFTGKIGVNALKDAVNLPAQVIPSVGLPTAQLLGGRPREAADTVLGGYVELAKHPGRTFTDHPLNTTLMVAGPVRGASRTIGAAGRSAGIGAFSTERAPAVVPHTNLRVHRSYDPDPLVKGVQVGAEKAMRRLAARWERQADEAEAKAKAAPHDLRASAYLDKAADLRSRAAKLDPDRMTAGQIGRRVHVHEGVTQSISSAHRDQATAGPRELVRKARHAGHALSPIAQAIVKPTVEDVRRYHDELTAEYDSLPKPEQGANRALRKGLAKAIRHAEKGRVDLGEVRELVEQHYGPIVAELEGKLHDAGILPRDRAERAKLVAPAVRNVDRGLVGATGADVSTASLRRALEERGHGEPFFVSQRPGNAAAGNYWRHFTNLGGVGRARRSGLATLRGTYDAHPETLVAQVARMQGLLDAHAGYRRWLDHFGMQIGGRLVTRGDRDAAVRLAQRLSAQPGSHGWRVVRADPWKGHGDSVESMIHGTLDEDVGAAARGGDHADQARTRTLADVLHDAVGGEGDGPYALIPKPAAEMMEKHVRVLDSGSIRKGFRKLTAAFSRNVLTTSKFWIAGNAIEGAVRSIGVAHALPKHATTFDRVQETMRRMDPVRAELMLHHGIPGGHMAYNRSSPRTAADAFQASPPAVAFVARKLAAFAQKRGPRQLAGLWSAYTTTVLRGNERFAEHPFQKMLAGKYIEGRFMRGVRDSEKAIEQAARGMMNTAEQDAMARFVQREYGKYAHFSPVGRRAKEFLPFYAWAMNAGRLLTVVLPKDHPVLSALLADLNVSSERWRRAHGADLFMGKGALPSWLQGSWPQSDGGHVPLQRFVPFGVATDPFNTAASLVLPQLDSALKGWQGVDWKNKPLRHDDGTPYNVLENGLYGIEQLLLGVTPGASAVQRFTGADGDALHRTRKLLDPFMPYAPARGSAPPPTGLPKGTLPRGGALPRDRLPKATLPR